MDELDKPVRSLKSKLKRRIKNLEKTFDPLQRHRRELEIESLKKTISVWNLQIAKSDFSFIESFAYLVKAIPSGNDSGDYFEIALDYFKRHWRKAQKALNH